MANGFFGWLAGDFERFGFRRHIMTHWISHQKLVDARLFWIMKKAGST